MASTSEMLMQASRQAERSAADINQSPGTKPQAREVSILANMELKTGFVCYETAKQFMSDM